MGFINSYIKTRAKHLAAVYVEKGRIEHLFCSFKKGEWQSQREAALEFPESELPFERLRQVDPAPGRRDQTDLIVIVSRSFYSFFKERYPVGLGSRLDQTLEFDWDENVIFENGNHLRFHGAPARSGNFFHVPMYTMDTEIHSAFEDSLKGSQYRNFILMPSAAAYEAFCPESSDDSYPSDFLSLHGRACRDSGLELHRLVGGKVLDSFELHPGGSALAPFRFSLTQLQETPDLPRPSIHLYFSNKEACGKKDGERGLRKLYDGELNIKEHALEGPILHSFVEQLTKKDVLDSFNGPKRINPKKVPSGVWGALILLFLYTSFAFFGLSEKDRWEARSKIKEAELSSLQMKWEPVKRQREKLEQMEQFERVVKEYGESIVPLVDVFELLAQVTPDDTWINDVRFNNNQLTLQGLSESAMSYLPILSGIKGFDEVQFVSSVRRDQRENKDRFIIRLSINTPELIEELDARGIDLE
jgi:Tfp pilus assembly protein PilN